ncbi:hypothetical protein [Actinokineospora iranica]|uniref:Uncharacterized protein n=1 Tax=Actinokineospora iranica TaxID=1271860 RepID=A0A1G6YZN9_9PSEU|nr:hypothetical protein [Actinokineospora iranica]SDD95105.1 hypothetical protein SAMN05216174_12430 [Actinokineospora iranica]
MPTRAALLCLAALTLTACSDQSPVPPPVAESNPQANTSPTASKDRMHGAPQVSEPLDPKACDDAKELAALAIDTVKSGR